MFITNSDTRSKPVFTQPPQSVAQTPDPVRGKQQFDEMVMPRKMDNETNLEQIDRWIAIGKEVEISCAQVTNQEVSLFLAEIDTLNFSEAAADSVLKSPKLPFIALEALRQGHLHPQYGQMQVATTLLFWSAMQCPEGKDGLKTVVFSQDEQIAHALIRTTLHTKSIGAQLFDRPTSSRVFLEGSKFDIFMQKLAALPPSEQRFLQVLEPYCDKSSVSFCAADTISYNLAFSFGMHLFKPDVMIPSFGMMQAFLEAEFGDEAPTLTPRTYLPTQHHFHTAGAPVIMLPTPDAQGNSRCPDHVCSPLLDRMRAYPAPWHHFSFYHFSCALAATEKARVEKGKPVPQVKAKKEQLPCEEIPFLTMKMVEEKIQSWSRVLALLERMDQDPERIRGQQQFEEMVIPRKVDGDTSARQLEKWTLIGQEVERTCTTVSIRKRKWLLSDYVCTLNHQAILIDSVLSRRKLPFIALEALRQGDLDPEHGQKQAATALLFWSAVRYHHGTDDLEIIDMDRNSTRAKAIITQTTANHHLPFAFLQGDKFDLFIRRVRAFPPSERRFLHVTRRYPLDNTVSHRLTEQQGVNLFRPDIMVPSFGMMQAFLDTEFGPDAVTLKPRTYLSTIRHIYETRVVGTSDMMIPTPDADGNSRCPDTADGHPAPWHHFSFHDFYHAIIASSMGATYRPALPVAADASRKYARTLPANRQGTLRRAAARMVDGDAPLFRKESDLLSSPYHGLSGAQKMWLWLGEKLVVSDVVGSEVLPDDCLLAFKEIYTAFVVEKKGPVEMDQESFDAAFTALKKRWSFGNSTLSYATHPLAWLKLLLLDLEQGKEPQSAQHYYQQTV